MNYVEPITDSRKIDVMSKYLYNNSIRNYIMFAVGINVGLRISDMIDKTVGFFRHAADVGYVELAPKKTDKTLERGKVISGLDDIGIECERRTVGKKKIVRVYMSRALRDTILDYLEGKNDSEYMFPSRKGGGSKFITRQQAYNIVNEAAREAGIKDAIGTHSMRKTFGYWHYQKNHDVRLLMEIFGHASEEITLRYIGITNEAKKESAEAMNLGIL